MVGEIRFKFTEPSSGVMRTVIKFTLCFEEIVSLQGSPFSKAVLLGSGYPLLFRFT